MYFCSTALQAAFCVIDRQMQLQMLYINKVTLFLLNCSKCALAFTIDMFSTNFVIQPCTFKHIYHLEFWAGDIKLDTCFLEPLCHMCKHFFTGCVDLFNRPNVKYLYF